MIKIDWQVAGLKWPVLKNSIRALPVVLVLTVPSVAHAEGEIGAVKTVIVHAYGSPAGEPRKPIYVHDAVHAQEVVETVSGGGLHLLFRDDTDLRLGSDSNITLDKFVFNPSDNSGELVASMSRGVFRYISGKVNKRGVLLRTPVSLIGIRGTDLTVEVDDDGTTLVAVSDGSVEVTPAGGGESATVNAGQGATVSVGSNSVDVAQSASPSSDAALDDASAVDADAAGGDGGGGGH